ncbi:MAG: alginate lyase family protein [Pyrinomonadaceae bacterium]
MAVVGMAKPLRKIKKIRSLDEIFTRGGQAYSVYREQRRAGAVPTDKEFVRLIDASQFGSAPVIAETIWQRFFNNAEESFFPSFAEREETIEAFRRTFGPEAEVHFINAADEIAAGRVDLMGLKGLFVGTQIDWHREPVSTKKSPLKHWKEFDELDTTETGNKKVIWELNRHQHFFTLGVAYMLSGDEHYAEIFAGHLSSWMDQNPPAMGINWASSLEVAFRSMSWIWAFHFFRDSEHLTPALFKDALKFLYLHGRHIEQYLSKYYSPNTHLTGEGLGLYYLGTQLPFLERAEHWRKLGEQILFSEIGKQVKPDGVYFEQSTWYQRYTVDIYSHFVILRALSGRNSAGKGTEILEGRLGTTFEMLRQFTMPDGSTPLIGDDDGGRMLPLTDAASDDFRGTLALGAILFDRGANKLVAGGPSQEILWLTGTEGLNAYSALKAAEPRDTSTQFPDGGYCTMRDGWSDTDNCLIVDCGNVGSLAGGHGHADALSIAVAMNGRSLLVDSGTYTYHESRELRDYFRSTIAHNTLEIDGVSSSEPGNAFGWTTRAEARCDNWLAEERFDFFAGSHDGYERLLDPATHERSILFLKGDYWIMRDLVKTAGEHDHSLNFHFDHGIETSIAENGEYVGGGDHRLFTFGDNGSWHQNESWISKNHGNRVNAPFLRFMSRGVGPQEFFTFILPVVDGIDAPTVSEIQTASGRAFAIRFLDYTDVFVFNDEPGRSIDNGIFESNFKYSWARLSEGERVPDEFVLIDGDRLKVGGREVFDSRELTYSSIRRLGSELYIKTDLGRSIRRLSK